MSTVIKMYKAKAAKMFGPKLRKAPFGKAIYLKPKDPTHYGVPGQLNWASPDMQAPFYLAQSGPGINEFYRVEGKPDKVKINLRVDMQQFFFHWGTDPATVIADQVAGPGQPLTPSQFGAEFRGEGATSWRPYTGPGTARADFLKWAKAVGKGGDGVTAVAIGPIRWAAINETLCFLTHYKGGIFHNGPIFKNNDGTMPPYWQMANMLNSVTSMIYGPKAGPHLHTNPDGDVKMAGWHTASTKTQLPDQGRATFGAPKGELHDLSPLFDSDTEIKTIMTKNGGELLRYMEVEVTFSLSQLQAHNLIPKETTALASPNAKAPSQAEAKQAPKQNASNATTSGKASSAQNSPKGDRNLVSGPLKEGSTQKGGYTLVHFYLKNLAVYLLSLIHISEPTRPY